MCPHCVRKLHGAVPRPLPQSPAAAAAGSAPGSCRRPRSPGVVFSPLTKKPRRSGVLDYLRPLQGGFFMVSTTAVFLRRSATLTGMNFPVPASRPIFLVLATVFTPNGGFYWAGPKPRPLRPMRTNEVVPATNASADKRIPNARNGSGYTLAQTLLLV